MKKKLITLLLASIVLTGCGAASRNASSQVYMAETAAAYDTASGAGNGMPAIPNPPPLILILKLLLMIPILSSYQKMISCPRIRKKIRIQIHLTPKTPLPKLPRRPWNAS